MDDDFQIATHFKTTADTAGVDELDRSIASAKGAIADLENKLQDASKAGEGFKIEGLNPSNLLDTARLVQDAIQNGLAIGDAIKGGIERVMEYGLNWDALFNGAADAKAFEEFNRGAAEQFAALQRAHSEMVDAINGTRPDNAMAWLDEVAAKSKAAAAALQQTQRLLAAKDKLETAQIEADYAERSAFVSTMPEDQRPAAEAEAKNEREKRLKEIRDRDRQRANEAAEAARIKTAMAANDAERMTAEQARRAQATANADLYAQDRQNAFAAAGEGKESQQAARDAAYRESLTRAGFDASGFGSAAEERKALEAARAAAAKARETADAARMNAFTVRGENTYQAKADDVTTSTRMRLNTENAAAQTQEIQARNKAKADAEAEREAAKRERETEAARRAAGGALAGDVQGAGKALSGEGFKAAAASLQNVTQGLRDGIDPSDVAAATRALENVANELGGGGSAELRKQLSTLFQRMRDLEQRMKHERGGR